MLLICVTHQEFLIVFTILGTKPECVYIKRYNYTDKNTKGRRRVYGVHVLCYCKQQRSMLVT